MIISKSNNNNPTRNTFLETELKEINNTIRFQFDKGVIWFTFFVTLNGTLMIGILAGFFKLISEKDALPNMNCNFIIILIVFMPLVLFTPIFLLFSCLQGKKLINSTDQVFKKMVLRMSKIIKQINNGNKLVGVESALFEDIYFVSLKHMKTTMNILILAWIIILLVILFLLFYFFIREYPLLFQEGDLLFNAVINLIFWLLRQQ